MAATVPLTRRFKPLPKDAKTVDADLNDWSSFLGLEKPKSWDDLHLMHRTVVLADAGAGKTVEMRGQTERLRKEGHAAFFLRIENLLNDGLDGALEIGTADDLATWLNSTDEGWFFLDSVDESRLDGPHKFERAIRCFSKGIAAATHRAHVCISSRPYAWRPTLDAELIKTHLPFKNPTDRTTGESRDERHEKLELDVHWLCPLNREDIRQFAVHRAADRVDEMLGAIDRANLWSLAERPFDLDQLIESWNTGQPFGGRLEILQSGIARRLGEIHPDRQDREPLPLSSAQQGARLLAAAIVLSGQPGIRVPEAQYNSIGLDSEALLGDQFCSKEISALLGRGIFNDAIYGAVRMRHREVRDLLAAEWIHGLLEAGAPRYRIESLLFADQYGEQVIRPRMRSILPWLILFDDAIRAKAIAISPEIAVEGGDPARLPLPERRTILRTMVEQIVRDVDGRNGRDNSAIARIAQLDLAHDALELIERHIDNDDAIFFLGRLVWQGRMASCLPSLERVACDPARSVYARIASIRAITVVGGAEPHSALWSRLIALPIALERRLLAELVQHAPADLRFVDLLLRSLSVLEPYQQFQSTGLTQAMHGFVERINQLKSGCAQELLLSFAQGIQSFVTREPYIDQADVRLSSRDIWLMPIAMHLIEKLVLMRSSYSLDAVVLELLLKSAVVQYTPGLIEIDDFKPQLQSEIPKWTELNDALFWASVAEKRAEQERSNGDRLTDDWPVSWRGHHWQFGMDDFDRVAGWVQSRPLHDDRLVALSLALRVSAQEDRPPEVMETLRRAVEGQAELEQRLADQLQPRPPRDDDFSRFMADREEKWRRQEREDAANRAAWIADLKASPDRVRHPSGIGPGEIGDDQCGLMQALDDVGVRFDRNGSAEWHKLIPEFGSDVAYAFRDAAVAHWRVYRSGLRSEGADTSLIPDALLFAMAGLAIESNENSCFPEGLADSDVSNALRYVVWELNGFPAWFERFYKVFPAKALEFVWTELAWELDATTETRQLNYILSRIVAYAPWLSAPVAGKLIDWLQEHEVANANALGDVFQIIQAGEALPADLAGLARKKLGGAHSQWQRPMWYSLWIDNDPETGIHCLREELNGLMDAAASSDFAQRFLKTLVGGRTGRGLIRGRYKIPQRLRELYELMHLHVRVEDDIHRAGTGVYSPELRDDAQDARDLLFRLLTDIPGKPTYIALKELAADHPDPGSRSWMLRSARQRAETDADQPPWGERRIIEFASKAGLKPGTHRELFDLGVSRLIDFKDWLERGNDSLATTYQKVLTENEMRAVVAKHLNDRAAGRFTCAQEAELANSQRPDIWLQNPSVAAPVPIELKLLDMGWSGPDLCERLRNQLVGDYLRDEQAGCGIMLLVWLGQKPGRKWEIEGQRVCVAELASALSSYWRSISDTFPKVEAIEIIVIDLTIRALRSGTPGVA